MRRAIFVLVMVSTIFFISACDKKNIESTDNSVGKEIIQEKETVRKEIEATVEDFDIREENGNLCIIGINNYNATILNIPNQINGKQVTKIATEAFDTSEVINSVTIPEGISIIEYKAFAACVNLEKIVLPESLEEIGQQVFLMCKELKEVKIPSKIKKLEDGVFAYCTNLKRIEIPDTVTEIHEEAFLDCSQLIIVGEKGSYAEEYANKNNILFEAK